ncbi:MAG: hypothetical protein ACRCUG_08690 [Yersinia sp. (in: enterobacteria)]
MTIAVPATAAAGIANPPESTDAATARPKKAPDIEKRTRCLMNSVAYALFFSLLASLTVSVVDVSLQSGAINVGMGISDMLTSELRWGAAT